MGSSPVWMPLYIADYNIDTAHLGALESGGYLHLIMHYWVQGCLPENDRQLAHIARMTPQQWAKAKPVIQAFFQDGWKHKRIDFEQKKAKAILTARRQAGSLGGEAKSLKYKDTHVTNGSVLPVANVLANGWQSSAQPQSHREECYSLDPTNSKQLPVSEKPACEKTRKKRVEYPPNFETFWKAYPTDANMAKTEAYTEWKKLGVEDREIAIKSVPGFRAYCASHPDYRPIHANRYLNRRRFEGHAETAAKTSALVFVAKDSPEGRAWWEFKLRTTGKYPPTDNSGGWRFNSKWPPDINENHGSSHEI